MINLHLNYDPLMLPSIAAAVIALALSWYAFKIRGSAPARTFAWYALMIFIWEITTVMELASITVAAKQLWTSIKYVGATAAPVLNIILTLQNTHMTRPLQWRWFVWSLWGWAIATTLIVLTNNWHHWYWQAVHIEPGVLELVTDKAGWFAVYAVGMYLTITASAVIYLWYVRTAAAVYKKQALWLSLGSLVPLILRAMSDFFGLVLVPGVDQVTLFILFTVICYAIAMFRYGAMKLVPVAHDQLVKNLQAVVIATDNERRILDANPYALALYGKTLTEVIGTDVSSFTGVADIEQQDGQEVWLTRQNQHLCYRIQVAPILDSSQHKIGWSLLLTDISRLKETEARLEAANQQRQRMTADIAHDLRTPLQVIGGYLEAMSEGILHPTEQRFATMGKEMEHLEKLVSDFMTIAKADAGDLQLNFYPQSVNALLQRLQELYQLRAEQSNKFFVVKLLLQDIDVSIDGDRILQVLHNLIRNAFNHTVAGDTITLSADTDADSLTIRVTDTGAGIKPEHLNLIFERLFRADASRELETGSHGLGLAICQSLIAAHHGQIGVRSEGEGCGAEFWFRLLLG